MMSDTYKPLENFNYTKEEFDRRTLTFDKIAKQLENTEYMIDYGWVKSILWHGVAFYPWKLYKNWELIWTWNDVSRFQISGDNMIICSWSDYIFGNHYCIINWKYEPMLDIDLLAYPQIYNGDIYKITTNFSKEVNWYLEKYWVFKNDTLLYTFESEHPTDANVYQLLLDDSWWRVYYNTIVLDETKSDVIWMTTHLVHNWQDIWELNWYDEIIGLWKIGNHTVYLYKNKWKVWYNLEWNDFKTAFIDISHDQCCEWASFRISFVDEWILFYGKQKWKYSLILWSLTGNNL